MRRQQQQQQQQQHHHHHQKQQQQQLVAIRRQTTQHNTKQNKTKKRAHPLRLIFTTENNLRAPASTSEEMGWWRRMSPTSTTSLTWLYASTSCAARHDTCCSGLHGSLDVKLHISCTPTNMWSLSGSFSYRCSKYRNKSKFLALRGKEEGKETVGERDDGHSGIWSRVAHRFAACMHLWRWDRNMASRS